MPTQDLGPDLRPRLDPGIEDTHNPRVTVQRQQVISIGRAKRCSFCRRLWLI